MLSGILRRFRIYRMVIDHRVLADAYTRDLAESPVNEVVVRSGKIFHLGEIVFETSLEAHRAMETNAAGDKTVVLADDAQA